MARRRVRDVEDEFVDAVGALPPAYFECRLNLRHDFPPNTPFRLVDTDVEDRRPRRGLRVFAERRLVCRHCGMVRVDIFAIARSRSGHTRLSKVGPGVYEQPDGYKLAGLQTAGMRDLLLGVAFDAQLQQNGHR
jgi:hypothetical protein